MLEKQLHKAEEEAKKQEEQAMSYFAQMNSAPIAGSSKEGSS
ncbi:MAG: hypothetical protein ACQEWV_31955 [Bacillota bacterium]